MNIFKYESYKEYKENQVKANKRKLDRIWALEEPIIFISDYIKKNIPDAEQGICHGVRNGWEVEKFKKYLDFKITGTELSDTANSFENVIEWDFHQTKDDWLDSIDFIYSNSLDHSYKPEFCVQQWLKCLKPEIGRCFIEWGKSHNKGFGKVDCFSADKKDYEQIISSVGEIEDVINITSKCRTQGTRKTCIFIVKR